MSKLSFVIPCYRSEPSIETVVSQIENVMQKITDEFEIILVNDHSPDRVWEKIKKMSSEKSNIIGIDLTRNFGQHSALMAGYAVAEGDVIVSMDDDGQTPIEELYSLLNKLDEGYDVVFAEYNEIKQSSFRRWGSKMNERMSVILANKPKDIRPTSFFVMRRYIVDAILKYQGAFPYISGLIYRTTKSIANVKVDHHERMYGKSGYNLRKLFSMWMNGFTAFSVLPLRLSSFLGCFFAFVGFVLCILIVLRKLFGGPVSMGYSSLMATIIFVGGVLMMLLGMIGEYIGRIYLCINNEPQYLIKEIVGKDGHMKFV